MAVETLQQAIRRYRAWDRLNRTWLFLQNLAFGCGAAMLLALAGDKLFYLHLRANFVAVMLASFALLMLLVYFLSRRPSDIRLGYWLDRKAGLRNLIATAASLAGQEDEVSSVLGRRAALTLRQHTPRQLMPLRPTRLGQWIPVLLLLLAVAAWLPPLDWLGRRTRAEAMAVEKATVRKGLLKLTAKAMNIEAAAGAVSTLEDPKMAKDFAALTNALMGSTQPEALLKLGEFENKYRQEFAGHRDFEQAIKAAAAATELPNLPPLSQQPFQALLKSCADGNLKGAADSLRELAKQLQSPDLTAGQKKALAKALKKLADSLAAKGISPELAKLLRDIEASSEDLEKLLSKCQAASRELSDMAQECADCAAFKAMKEGLTDAKREMLGEAFSDFDAKRVEQLLEEEAFLGGLEGNGSGNGTGGKGHGRGGAPPEEETDVAFQKTLSPSQLKKGRILHEIMVSGIPDKGEALNEYTDVVKAAQEHAASSLAQDNIPRECQDMVKKYFDSLEPEKPHESP